MLAVPAHFHSDGARLGMFHHIAQGGLRDPETLRFDDWIQALLQGVNPNLSLQAGLLNMSDIGAGASGMKGISFYESTSYYFINF